MTETLTGLRRLNLMKRTNNSSGASEDLKHWWADLDSTDIGQAYHAIGQLVTASQESVPFLNKHLRPAG